METFSELVMELYSFFAMHIPSVSDFAESLDHQRAASLEIDDSDVRRRQAVSFMPVAPLGQSVNATP
jgi:hypothetical protein